MTDLNRRRDLRLRSCHLEMTLFEFESTYEYTVSDQLDPILGFRHEMTKITSPAKNEQPRTSKRLDRIDPSS